MSLVALYHLEAGGIDSATAETPPRILRGPDHFNGDASDSAGVGPTVIAPNEANIVYSPCNWHVAAARAQAINPDVLPHPAHRQPDRNCFAI